MFFLLGRRYPYITLLIGAAILIIGVVRGDILAEAVGCLGLVVGGYRCVAALRRRGVAGGGRLTGGSVNDGSGSGSRGSLR